MMEARLSSLEHLHLPHPHDLPSAGLSSSHAAARPLWPGARTAKAQDDAFEKLSPRFPSNKSMAATHMDVDDQMSLEEEEDHDMEQRDPDNHEDDTSKQSISFLHTPLPLPNVDVRNSSTEKSTTAHKVIDVLQQMGRDRRADGLKPPTLALSLGHGKHADFRPWTRDCTEDVLNENVMRSGYTDKPPNSTQSESNMARPVIWPNLKTKNGLPVLSALFVQIMDKRQALGRCTAPSTFKPPPRVTLTDAKREAWLRDLASSEVPLRRLSRTIPHGIRGKALLDQCLVKTVPLARAVWLVKCVGANEIRAFRRKGISGTVAQSGESKWIREWTLCVEQFISNTVSTCGQTNWKSQMHYATRFVAALHSEKLLDRQHFLEWLIGSFATSSQDHLPVWTLFVQLFWIPLTKIHRRGRLLGEAIAAQMAALQAQDDTVAFQNLIIAFEKCLARLANTRSLVALRNWPTVRSVLENLARQAVEPQTKTLWKTIIHRNDRLNASASQARIATKSRRLKLFEFLDSTAVVHDLQSIASTCQSLCPDRYMLVQSLVDWASSVYRTGISRCFLAMRLLRHLADLGVDLEPAILQRLAGPLSTNTDQSLVNKLINGLIKTGHFNFGKYLQWLVSTGVSSGQIRGHTSLLFSVAPHGLSVYNKSLRRIIMSRVNAPLDDTQILSILQEQTIAYMKQDVPVDVNVADTLVDKLSSLQSASKETFASWLAGHIRTSMAASSAHFREDTPRPLGSGGFAVVRFILETISDFTTLSELLAMLIPLANSKELAEYAATVQNNIIVFAAIECLRDLTASLLRRQSQLRQTGQQDQILLQSLLSLCHQQSANERQVAALENDLLTCEQQHAAAVCSPASDSMLAVPSGQINVDEDIDRILSSGNMMEEQMLARVFSAIVERTVKWTIAGFTTLSNPSRWFGQLRMFDAATFDKHMNNLVGKLAANAGTDQVRAILIALVASGCLKIHDALTVFEKRLDTLEANSAPQLPRFALGTLQTFLPTRDLERHALNWDIYRFRLAQADVCRQHRSRLLRFVWHGLSAPAEPPSLIFSNTVISWLMECCVQQPDVLKNGLRVGSHTDDHKNAQVLRLILAMSRGLLMTHASSHQGKDLATPDADTLIRSSDELCLPFIRMILDQANGAELPGYLTSDIRNAFEAAIKEHSALWPQLLGYAGVATTQSIHRKACDAIIGRIHDTDGADGSSAIDIKSDLQVATITASQDSETESSSLERTAESFRALASSLKNEDIAASAQTEILQRINILIQLSIIGVCALSDDARTANPVQRLLQNIVDLIAEPRLQFHANLLDSISDCATLLARDCSLETLAAVHSRLSSTAKQDDRVSFILGIEESDCKWLSLASRIPIQTPQQQQQQSNVSPTLGQGPIPTLRQQSQTSTPSISRSFSGSAPSLQTTALSSPQTPVPQTPTTARPNVPMGQDMKFTAYTLRRWEMMQDPTPNMGENDSSLSLALFAARKVI